MKDKKVPEVKSVCAKNRNMSKVSLGPWRISLSAGFAMRNRG